MRQKLKEAYASTCQARPNHLCFCLQTLRQGNLMMVAYLDKVKSIVDNLAVAGQPLDIVTACDVSVTFPTLQNLLLTQEHRLQVLQELNSLDVSSHLSANVATREAFNLTYQQTNPPKAHAASLDGSHDLAWYTDSGASHHIATDAALLTDLDAYIGSDQVVLGNGAESKSDRTILKGRNRNELYIVDHTTSPFCLPV
ncbi:hypothetical protein H6P81_017361 [Aristolochia fimbriata]|uniref:Uncharacterized protein n=1 Tax=Aristolochia fimbriata TaxID=158543 RepID=A0AAV7E291_ARIFI|nr:hypothetical protein H6P81_017361 [Aristolochia fimbriata]